MRDQWDNRGMVPDLSRLPPEIRATFTQPISLRPDERYTAFVIYANTPGLFHPNARLNVARFKKEAEGSSAINVNDGFELDIRDTTGRVNLATAVISKENFEPLLAGMIRIYREMGGDVDAIIAKSLEVRRSEAVTDYFEENNDE